MRTAIAIRGLGSVSSALPAIAMQSALESRSPQVAELRPARCAAAAATCLITICACSSASAQPIAWTRSALSGRAVKPKPGPGYFPGDTRPYAKELKTNLQNWEGHQMKKATGIAIMIVLLANIGTRTRPGTPGNNCRQDHRSRRASRRRRIGTGEQYSYRCCL